MSKVRIRNSCSNDDNENDNHEMIPSEQSKQSNDRLCYSFLTSKITIAITILRLLLSFLSSSSSSSSSSYCNSSSSIHNNASRGTCRGSTCINKMIGTIVLQSILINPIWTMEHVIEANAIRNIFSTTTSATASVSTIQSLFADAYSGNQIHIPPLLLAFIESILPNAAAVTTTTTVFNKYSYNYYWIVLLLVQIFGLVVDFIISYQMELFVKQIFKKDPSLYYDDPTSTTNTIGGEGYLMSQMDPKIYPELCHIFPVHIDDERHTVVSSLDTKSTKKLTTTLIDTNASTTEIIQIDTFSQSLSIGAAAASSSSTTITTTTPTPVIESSLMLAICNMTSDTDADTDTTKCNNNDSNHCPSAAGVVNHINTTTMTTTTAAPTQQDPQEPKELQLQLQQESQQLTQLSTFFHRDDIPYFVSQLYYTNPITIIACNYFGSFQNIRVLFVLYSINNLLLVMQQNNTVQQLPSTDDDSTTYTTTSNNKNNNTIRWKNKILHSSIVLVMASYIDIHLHVFLIPAYFIIVTSNSTTNIGNRIATSKSSSRAGILLFCSYILYTIALYSLDYLLIGGNFTNSNNNNNNNNNNNKYNYMSVIQSTHWYSFLLCSGNGGNVGNGNDGNTNTMMMMFSSISEPSLSTVWYLSMELFGRFRLYYTIVFGGIPYILIIPLTIRLYRYPAVLIALFWMVGVLFRPPSTLYELNIGLCLMMASPQSLARMSKIVASVCICAIPIPVCLYLVSYYMWIGPNTGEANFVYFQCLAYNVFVALLTLLFCAASLRRDKALRVTAKRLQQEQQQQQQESQLQPQQLHHDNDKMGDAVS